MLDRVQIYSILGQVLSRLADQGTPLSVDQHLRLATLLDQLRSPLSREQLSLVLTPILANTPEAQTNLHRWFAEAVLLVPEKEKNPNVAPPTLPKDYLPPVPETMDQVTENDAAESEPPKPFDLDASVDAPSPSETYVAELQTFDKPPYVWTVELGAEREFATTADFRQLVNRMHDRQLLEACELDIAATINTLLKQPGQVVLHYRQLTQAPSYLLLIDQRAQNDHRAKIFDLLYTNLQFNEVQVSRFYFHADPKLCFNDDYPLGIPVAQLYPQNRSARLLILTYGYELFSSSTNAWSPWTKVFLQWKDRAILSPLPTSSWGAMEQRLAERFTILPATPLGLAGAIEEFQAEEAQHWEDYLALITDAPTEPIYYQGDLISTLEQYYPDPTIRKWIAACALYPTLHWELTLHIGTLLQREYLYPNLTSVENLLELVRLPWFVDGRIPDQARDELVQWLEATGEEVRVRSLLLESLDRAPAPPDGSVAYADYRMQVVFNQWMLEQDAVKKAELENEFLLFLETGKIAEFVTLKRLERAAKRTEFEVPAHWRKKMLQDQWEEKTEPKAASELADWLIASTNIPKFLIEDKIDEAFNLLLKGINADSSLYHTVMDAYDGYTQGMRENKVDAVFKVKQFIVNTVKENFKITNPLWLGQLQTIEVSLPLKSKGVNYLLAIAIDEYQHCLKLNNAVRDVESFVDVLLKYYQFEQENLIFLKNEEATSKNIEQVFSRLTNIVDRQDNLVIYFSGHGLYDERQGGFWIPVEAQPGDDNWANYFSNDAVRSYLSKINSFHTFLIADSCFSGSLFIDKRVEKFPSYRRDTLPSRWGLTSGKKEIMSDGQPGQKSPFATKLLDMLLFSVQPPRVMQICDLVLNNVVPNAQQIPIGSPLRVPGHQGGEFVFLSKHDEGEAWRDLDKDNTETDKPVEGYIPSIFVAYSHTDKQYLEALRRSLSPLIRKKKAKIWFDGEIHPGNLWDDEITSAIVNADIILLLVSVDSLHSDYFYEKGVENALKRHENKQVKVIPILLTPCLWDETPLHKLQVLPSEAKPITSWQNLPEAWDDVARGIRYAIDEIIKQKDEESKLEESKLQKEFHSQGPSEQEVDLKTSFFHSACIFAHKAEEAVEKSSKRAYLYEYFKKEMLLALQHGFTRSEIGLATVVYERREGDFKQIPKKYWDAIEYHIFGNRSNQGGKANYLRDKEEVIHPQAQFEYEADLKTTFFHSACMFALKAKEAEEKSSKQAELYEHFKKEMLFAIEQGFGQTEFDIIRLVEERNKGYFRHIPPPYWDTITTIIFGKGNFISTEEKEIWERVPKNREDALRRFIRENPASPYVTEAQRQIDQLRASARLGPDHMVLVKGGTFQMGDANGQSDEMPVHSVVLSDFLIAKYALTFEEYDAFCKATGRDLPNDRGWGRGIRPVINVSWFDAVDYCNWRSQQEGLNPVYQVDKEQVSPNWQANGYRLPTEAEWEYAAQGGQQHQGFDYAGSNNVEEVAWYNKNSRGKTHPVGEKKANELGLRDMSGNVWEWCWDSYDRYYYAKSPSNNPKGPDTGAYRVLRGGSWYYIPTVARIAYRNDFPPDSRYVDLGFRLARTAITL